MHVQIRRRMTRRRDWKWKRADLVVGMGVKISVGLRESYKERDGSPYGCVVVHGEGW